MAQSGRFRSVSAHFFASCARLMSSLSMCWILTYFTVFPQGAKNGSRDAELKRILGGFLQNWFKNLLVQAGRFSQCGRDAVP
jgi:hypothetical protein